MRLCRKRLWFLIAGVWIAISCGCSRTSENAPGPAGRPGGALSTIRYARGFTLERRPGYRLLRVLSPWRNARTSFAYALVERGAPVPEIEPGATLVETPVRRIVLGSTTFIPYFALLGLEDAIVGISGCRMVDTPSVAARIRSGRILEVGDGAGSAKGFNLERLVGLQPDLVMLYGTGDPQYDQHGKLAEGGLRPALNSEYMETTPLGRSEWIKFIAAFFNKEEAAERLFGELASRYQALAARTRSVATKPSVFCGANHRGSWYVPGGDSYVAAFLRDAGAEYVWKDDPSAGSMVVNAESVLARGRDAEFWLNPGVARSREELAAEDERHSVFRSFRSGRVYNNNARMDAGGGNDIWETGVSNPDKVLADLISIFHPELLPGHRRTWYWQLPEKASGLR